MARRRDGLAPYEIMGAAKADEDAAAPDPVPAAMPSSPATAWWDAGAPVVLRLPRGFAALLAVAVLGLVLLAYWVGHSRGGAATRAEIEQAQADARIGRGIPDAPLRIPVIGGATTEPDGVTTGGGTGPAQPAAAGRRVSGLNYLVLASYPPAEAERLASFLRERGVEIGVVPSDTARLAQVVALRGFTSEQYRAGEHRDHEERLRRFGREWQAANGGKGDSLGSMFWERYAGP